MVGTTPSAGLLGRIRRGEVGGMMFFGPSITTRSALIEVAHVRARPQNVYTLARSVHIVFRAILVVDSSVNPVIRRVRSCLTLQRLGRVRTRGRGFQAILGGHSSGD